MPKYFVQRGGWWVIGQFVLLAIICGLGIACRQEPAHRLLFLASLVFLMFSAICGIPGIIGLGRNLTPFPKPSEQTRLVRHGIYGWIRHPLYTAVIYAAFGWSLFWQSWPALAASAVLAVYLNAKARREEHWLRQQFPDYKTYERQVKRFIPGIY